MKSNRNCFVLVADGFNEESIAQTAEYFRDINVNLTFLSLYLNQATANLAQKYGTCATPGVLLGDMLRQELPDGLLVAGGMLCGQHLLIDPRVCQLVQKMHLAARPVGVLYPVYVPLVEAISCLPESKPLIFQEQQYTETFFYKFFSRMSTSTLNPLQRLAHLPLLF